MKINKKPRKRGYLLPWDVLKLKSNMEVKRAARITVSEKNEKSMEASSRTREGSSQEGAFSEGGIPSGPSQKTE